MIKNYLKIIASILGALTILLVLNGCYEDEQVVHVDFDKRIDISLAQPDKAITYAYLPQYSHSVSYERHWRLVEKLMQQSGLHVRQVFPDTFDAHINMVDLGEIDISFSNPFIYIKLAEKGAKAFARTIESDGKTDFNGQIISRLDNKQINTIEDCRGKSWIAVDSSSAGGYLFPLGHFVEHGVSLNDFSVIAFAPGPGGKQEKVVLSVYAGQYDVGSIRTGTLNILKDRIDLDQIRILAETRPYPGWVYAARKGLDPEIIEKMKRVMFGLSMDNKEDAVILEAAKIQGIIPATDSDYDSIRELAERLQLR